MKTYDAIHCGEDAAAVLMSGIPRRLRRVQECFVVQALNAQNAAVGRPVLTSVGTANAVEVHPRDVFRAAVQRNASAVIVAHNHPSGRLEMSVEDRMVAARLRKAGDLLGVPLLDFLVLSADGEYASAAELNWPGGG